MSNNPQQDQVAGLAREVENLARTLEQLTPVQAQLDELDRVVGQDIATIRAQLDQLWPTIGRLVRDNQTQQPPPDDAQGAPTWLGFTGTTDDATALLHNISDWVQDIYLRFDDAHKLPACWLWHPDIIEELLTLRADWIRAWSPRAPHTAPADWLNRLRPPTVQRIRSYAGSCNIENHLTDSKIEKRRRPAAIVVLEDAIPDIAKWWCGDRDGLAPEPTQAQIDTVLNYENTRRQ